MMNLSAGHRRLASEVPSATSISEAAEALGTSRSNVYASLRRLARAQEVRSVPELVTLLRSGRLYVPDE